MRVLQSGETSPVSDNQQSLNGLKAPLGTGVVASLLALGAGIAFGIVIHQTQQPALLLLEKSVLPVGQVWLAALQMTVLPLVLSNLVTAILSNAEAQVFGRLGFGAVGLFVAFLVAGACFGVGAWALIAGLIPVTPETSAGFAAMGETGNAIAVTPGDSVDLTAWLVSLIPTNPFGALSEGQLLPTLLFTVAFSIAATRVPRPARTALQTFFLAVSQTMMVLVHWILKATPLGVFALSLSFSSLVGGELATAVIQYLILICAGLAVFTALLYPATRLFAGVPMKRFARAALPAQAVAVSTRSSLASLPALVEGAKAGLGLRATVSDIVLPLAVSLFKSNRTISSTLKLLFLAHLIGLDLDSSQILVFVVTIIVVSFSAVGIPLGGGGLKSLPAYLAAGIPVEAYVMFKAVEAVPDIFKTLLNVTADLSVAAILNRHVVMEAEIRPAPEKGTLLAAGEPSRDGP